VAAPTGQALGFQTPPPWREDSSLEAFFFEAFFFEDAPQKVSSTLF
jgi:hypothetical protein